MRPTILFWALIMHCHPQECAFGNWARAHENDPHDAVIGVPLISVPKVPVLSLGNSSGWPAFS